MSLIKNSHSPLCHAHSPCEISFKSSCTCILLGAVVSIICPGYVRNTTTKNESFSPAKSAPANGASLAEETDFYWLAWFIHKEATVVDFFIKFSFIMNILINHSPHVVQHAHVHVITLIE